MTSSRSTVMLGALSIASVTAWLNASRPTASAAARRDGGPVGAGDDQRAEPAQLVLQQAQRPVGQVRSQAVGADQLGHPVGFVRGGHAARAHLVERDMRAVPRRLPGRLRYPASPAPMTTTSGEVGSWKLEDRSFLAVRSPLDGPDAEGSRAHCTARERV